LPLSTPPFCQEALASQTFRYVAHGVQQDVLDEGRPLWALRSPFSSSGALRLRPAKICSVDPHAVQKHADLARARFAGSQFDSLKGSNTVGN